MESAFPVLLLLSVGFASAQQRVVCDVCHNDGVGHLIYGYTYDVAWAYDTCCMAGGCYMEVHDRSVACNTTVDERGSIHLFDQVRLMIQLSTSLLPSPCVANDTMSTCPPIYTIDLEAPDFVRPPLTNRPVDAGAVCEVSCRVIGLD